jgi:hypothetical protein
VSDVLRRRRQRHGERLGQIGDAGLPGEQAAEDGPTHRVGEGAVRSVQPIFNH